MALDDVDAAGAGGAAGWSTSAEKSIGAPVRCMQCGPVAVGCKAKPPVAACVCTDVCT